MLRIAQINFYLWYIDERQIGKTDEKPEELWDPAIEILGAVEIDELIMEGKGSVRHENVLPAWSSPC